MDEAKDKRLKYLELPRVFHDRANMVSLTAKQHLRICQQLAVRLAKEKTKTPAEFERNEYMKDFVIKSAQLNEDTLTLLTYVEGVLNEIAADHSLSDKAKQLDTLTFQSDTIQILTRQRDDLVKDLYDEKKRQFSAVDKRPV